MNNLEKLQVYSQNKRVYTKRSNMSFLIFWKFKGSLATAYPLSSFHKWILEVLEKRTCEKQLMTIPMPTVRKPISIKLRRENNAFWKLKKTLYSKMHNTTLFSSHYYSLFVSLRLYVEGRYNVLIFLSMHFDTNTLLYNADYQRTNLTGAFKIR